MSDLTEFNELTVQFHDRLDAFEESFYNASPERRLFNKKTYKDYVDHWGRDEKETYARIYSQVKDYPHWHWFVRLGYWLINDDNYIKYQWVVYKQRESELIAEKEAIIMGWIKDPMTPLVEILKFEGISYLPRACRGLLGKLKNLFIELNIRWRSIMHIRLNGETKASPTSTSGLAATTHFKVQSAFSGESKQQAVGRSDRKLDFFEHKDDRVVYSKICGFLKRPQGTPIEILKQSLQQLNQANLGGTPTITLKMQLKQHIRRISLLIAECGSQLRILSSTYKGDSFKNLVASDDASIQSAREQAYLEGEKEADEILQRKLEKALEHSSRHLVLFKQEIGRQATAISQKDIDKVCNFYKACGFFKVEHAELKPENVWKKVIQYTQKFHPDKMIRSENLTSCDVAIIAEGYNGTFKAINNLFDNMKSVKPGDIPLERCGLSSVDIEKLRMEGEKCRELSDELYKLVIKNNVNIVASCDSSAKRRRQTAEREKQIAEHEKQIAEREKRTAELDKRTAERKTQIAQLTKDCDTLKQELEATKKERAERQALQRISAQPTVEFKSDAVSTSQLKKSSLATLVSPLSPKKEDVTLLRPSSPLALSDGVVGASTSKATFFSDGDLPSHSKSFSLKPTQAEQRFEL